jgi:hypothetical protein
MSVRPSIHPSVLPYGTTCFPPDGFSWNLAFDYFSKTCGENSISIKIWQKLRVFYMKTNIHFWSHLSHFFLDYDVLSNPVRYDEFLKEIPCCRSFPRRNKKRKRSSIWHRFQDHQHIDIGCLRQLVLLYALITVISDMHCHRSLWNVDVTTAIV